MSKKYNLNSKSDMRKFQRDLEKTVMHKAKSAIMKKQFDVTCPHCQSKVNIPAGKSLCPSCRKQIDFKINFK